jgi:triacylglycerol esterase/lipase EstA (alpha/beta hydrolase family)
MTRYRQKAWREKPDLMESIRQRATARAKAVRDKKTDRLKFYLAELPDRMTKEELKTLIVDEYCQQTKVDPASFYRHVKRHGLLSYDGAVGLWVNLTKETKA